MLTIFSSPKPFRGHIDIIQRNAIASWQALGSEVEVLLIGDEEGLDRAAQDYAVRAFPEVMRNDFGTPLISAIFDIASQESRYDVLCYANSDILFLDDLLPTLQRIQQKFSEFLVLGRRWDLEVRELLEYRNGWAEALRDRLREEGRRHPPAGSDYFVFRRGTLPPLPDFALGRAGWDNWMIYAGRAARLPVIDASEAITVIHQDHDYGHLPGGKPHYRLPETDRNVSLAGGQEMIFTLDDADWRMTRDGLGRRPRRERWALRGIEASLIARFGPGGISRGARILFHPKAAFGYYYQAVRRRLARMNREKGR